jgi:hypothetical protein
MEIFYLYLFLAVISGVIAWGISDRWRRNSTKYRILWLVAVCLFARYQYLFLRDQMETNAALHHASGEAGLGATGLWYMTILTLPLTMAGFVLCLLWPKDKHVFSWSSVLVVLLTIGVSAGGSWLLHQHDRIVAERVKTSQ